MGTSARRAAAACAATALLCATAAQAAGAQAPPQPDFFWPYGTATILGVNLVPPVQPVIAFIDGRACGNGETKIAAASNDNPPADVGKTVYVVNVLAAGTGLGQRPGCGGSGSTVVLYFPVAGRIAIQSPAFVPGGRRVDLELGIALPNRLVLPMAAAEGGS